MAELSSDLLNNLANSALDFFVDLNNRENPVWQHLQTKPLLNALRKGQKTFGGAKEYISTSATIDVISNYLGYITSDCNLNRILS